MLLLQTQTLISATLVDTSNTTTPEKFNMTKSILVMTVTGNQVRNSSYNLTSPANTPLSALWC